MEEKKESKPEQQQILQPGVVIRPYVPENVARDIVQRVFGLKVTKIKELNSYDDRNFFVLMEEENNNNPNIDHVCTDGYVLKVTNSFDSKRPESLDGQNQLMLYLNERGVNCPLPVKNIHGNYSSLEKLYKKETNNLEENNVATERPHGNHLVRMLTFLPGQIFYNVPYTEELFYQTGKYLAQIDTIMQDFHHPVYDTYDTIWSLQSTPRLVDFTFAVRDDECRELATKVIDTFTQTVVPCYPNMQRGQLHGDFNEQNIIVRPKPGTEDHAQPEYQVAGFIDFGDCHRSYYVFELALLVTYMMLENKNADLIEVGGHVIAGYFSVKPLSDEEFDLLKVCVASRYTQSLVMGEYTYTQTDPGNEYLLTTAKAGWPQLKRLWSTPKEEIKATWKAIMNTYK